VDEDDRESFDLTAASSDLGGVVAGELLSSLIPGGLPVGVGAGIGVGMAHTIRYLITEAKGRFFSPREKRRVMTLLGLIAIAIQREKVAGRTPRDDEFFDREIDGRTTAQELGESVLYAAQREHEERKLPFLANLYAYFAFESQIDQGMANYLVKLASAVLTYRQYCLLEIARTPDGRGLLPPGLLNKSQREDPSQVFAVLAECFELYRLGLIKFTNQFGLVTKVEDMAVQEIALDIPIGTHLHIGMRLRELPSEDVEAVAKLISAP
jgi:hypothetical protein